MNVSVKPSLVQLPNRQMMLDAALEYISKGYSVLPLHTIIDGACTCGNDNCASPGKHPLTKNGHLDASSDEVMVRGWWAKWPFANIGMAITNGMVVVDVDPRNGGDIQFEMLEAEHGKFPDTATQLTGGGGYHYIYRTARDTSTLPGRLGKGIDLKTSGFIVAWPSVHISGNTYEHEASSNMLDGFHLNEPPQWIFNIGRADVAHSGNRVCSTEQVAELRSALNFLESDDYHNWINVGLSLSTIGQQGYGLWDEWSQLSDKYDAAALRDKWRSFRNSKSSRNIESIFFEAQQAGWKNPLKASGILDADAPSILIESLLGANEPVEIKNKPVAELPTSLKKLPVANLQWLADYISSFSEAPEPAASQLGAIMLGSVLTGRIYKSSNNNYTNLMTGLIASSGRGKQYVQEGIHSVLESCQLSKYVAGSFYTHQSAVYAALSRQPVHICISDEFGDSFMEARKSQNSSKMSVFKAFKRAYSDSSSLFKAETYADNANLAKDKQDKPPIMRPCLSVLGLATPGQFWSEITPQHIEGGLFNRFIVVQIDDFEKPQRSRKGIQDLPEDMIEWVKQLNRFDDAYCHTAASMVPGRQGIIAISDEAMEVFNRFWDEQDARGDELGRSDEYMANMPRRWRENAMRLATILGACADKVITPVLAQWAIDYVRWHGERTITTLMTRVGTENQYSADMKRVLSFVSATPDGVQTRALLRRFTTMRKRDLDEVISHLVAAGKIEVIEKDNDKTRKSVIVRAVLS